MSFTSNTISLLDLQTSLGGNNPIGLNEYYSDAVPGYAVGVSGIPTVGNEINMNQFRGKTIPTVITLNNSGNTLSNYAVNFTLNYKSSYATNFQDLRFYDETTNTLLNHWYESVSNGVSANVWVRVPAFVNGNRIKVSVGNTSTQGTASNVFSLYDDFSGTFNTTNKWTVSGGTYTTSTSNFSMTSTTFTYVVSQSNFTRDIVIETSVRSSSSTGIPELIVRGNIANNTGMKARADCRAAGNGGVGSLVTPPFASWNLLTQPQNFSFPSNNTAQRLLFTCSSSNFTVFYNNSNVGSYTNSLADYNNDGVIGFANHNGRPVTYEWIRAYPSTSNTVSVSVS
jgi:hypothetical protein